jgi:CRISPR/Cas system-associated exonuclease Cas4 (RecB family)
MDSDHLGTEETKMTITLKIKSNMADDYTPYPGERTEYGRVHDVEFALTTDHATSSYGIPVLVDSNGTAYGASDRVPLACVQPASYAVELAFANYPTGEDLSFGAEPVPADYQAQYNSAAKMVESFCR